MEPLTKPNLTPTFQLNYIMNEAQQQSQNFSSPPSASAPSDSSRLRALDSTVSVESTTGLHRRRTLYLIRHGEAAHNVLEATAQQAAKLQAEQLGLSPEETYERMEAARKSVLTDNSLRDANLTEKGRQQARDVATELHRIVEERQIHPPTEAMVSPLSRCLETAKIVLEPHDIAAHIRPELSERRTQFPPDTPRPLEELLRITSDDDRFTINNTESLSKEKAEQEAQVRESKEMLRERASHMFDLLMEMEHRHVMVVSHKGFLRELERGLLEIPDSPLFGNCELRVYRVIFTLGDRELYQVERLH